MAWLTHLLSAVLASTTPTHAASTTHWTVIVGGASADTSIYANAFFPQTIEIGVGDTVIWTFEGFHNVAFLSGGVAPQFAVPEGDKTYWNPQMLFPVGGPSYDGTGYHTSGLPRPDGRLSYTLTFTKPGRYRYECTIHSGMRGMVIVTDKPTRHGTSYVVPLVGNSQQRYSVLRFTREPLVVPLGSTVTWAMRDTFEIHTVTFTSGEEPPRFAVPEPQSSGAPKVLLNPKALTPTNTTRYDGTGYVNSGLLFPPGNPGKLASSFSLTFTKPGRFEYWCLVHAEAGQRGIVVVQ